MINEDQLEQLCLNWFKAEGYEYVYGPDIAHDGDTPERSDYQQVVLLGRLVSALQKINPHIPLETLEEASLFVTKSESPVLVHNNRAFHKQLLEGIPVEYKDGEETRTDHVQLIDFQNVDNNQLLVVNQFTIAGAKQLRRPDIVVFINGLPISVIELKNPADENADIWSAYNQLQTYKEEIADLFVCNEALVISDGLTARIGSLTVNKERFLPWRTIKDVKKIAIEITEKLRKSTTVDWQVRDSVRAKLRNLVRRTLRRWKYPPDKQDAAVELVMRQAEVLCEGWA